MKKVNKLIHFNDTRKDLLYWIKQFFIDKIANTTKDHISDDFDMALYIEHLRGNEADTIEKVKAIVNDSITNGLKSVKVPLRVVVSFYEFIDQNHANFKSIMDINGGTLEHFVRKENVHATDSKKNELFGGVRNLFNFIDDHSDGEHIFQISKGVDGKVIKIHNRKVQRKTIPAHLNEENMKKFHDVMLKIEYPDNLERNRDILIGRLFLFSGIQTSEMIALKDDDFVEDEEGKDIIWLHIRGKGAAKRKIPMPRRRLIVYLNAYKEARGVSQNDRLFFAPSDKERKKEIGEAMVRNITERIGKHAGIKEKCSPAILRNSFGIFIYRKMSAEGNPNADRYVKDLMGHSDIKVTRALVKFENPKLMLAADCWNGFKVTLG